MRSYYAKDIYYNKNYEVIAFQWVNDKDAWPQWINDLYDKNRILVDASKTFYLISSISPEKLTEGDWVVRYSDNGVQVRRDDVFSKEYDFHRSE